ncbi:Predicted dehydrogenase [Cohaesibacter sp. ES.047]|uniref:Gfo/Idh/MocA family protein n=1 Tax=Cohaesibacter sp. ES.047 TaxID=1798205 RepID=UPI000BB9377D|nr:Gfo/Idh/MocA family oxidoreductase [Cohaesibacter sp. ES.047]SNY91686.1 Predicted dehydrogenase [Cohaesibacter sp. ES.047]
MRRLKVGLIGTGYMGKCHALAYGNVRAVFGDVPPVEKDMLCDVPAQKAEDLADQFGFARSTDSWQELVSDPNIDIISITTPNKFHKEMALSAIEHGKHVWCEKPLALTTNDATEMAEAARKAGVKTMVGYNYLKNPIIAHAKQLVEDGAIGRLLHFRGWVDEDYQADPSLAWTWRATKSEAGLGALGDLGCHLVSIAHELAGPIESLTADMATVYPERPMPEGDGMGKVENEDVATAICRFGSGILGTLSSSRSAWGRKNHLAWELHGDKGMLIYDQERMNELRLYQNEGPVSEQGFKTILSGPTHPHYAHFCPSAGHGLGFNELKVIELAEFLRAIDQGTRPYPDFDAALAFEKVIHAMAQSAEEKSWISL